MEQQPTKSFGKPEGLVGHFLGMIMAKSNRKLGEWTIFVSELMDGEDVLEIGFGPGTTIQLISEKFPNTFIAGIDHSDVMVKQATKRNKKAIREGKIEVFPGSVSKIPYENDSFDKVYAINSFQFWPDRLQNLKEVKRVLKHEGKIVITMQPRWAKTDEEVKHMGKEVSGWLTDAGYKDIKIDFKSMKPISVVCVTAIKD
ncbi:MAG TPA: class I SAM-dependent methyltransferase [Balneolales bacterium]|nr:class I SAM-dependent methyltransferase [Balneolales bacterium]